MIRRWAFPLLFTSWTLSCAGTMKGGGTADEAGGAGGSQAASGGLAGTGGSPSSSGGTTGGSASGSGGASSSGGASGGDASGGGSATGGAPLVPESCPTTADLGVRLIGRHDGCTQGGVRQAWSGAGFVARFEGTGLAFDQDGPAVEYTLVVDGVVQPKVVTTAGRTTTMAVSGLSPGEHSVEVRRRGEASFGTTTLYAVEASDGSLLSAPAEPSRLIEIVGDSITCGYGNEGPDVSCSFSSETENHYMTYGAILARAFGAELSAVAWSGRGVVSNYGGEAGPTLPDLYERAIPADDSSVWGFRAQPALVIINLGTNDYSTENDPATEHFVAGYESLLTTIRARYPEAMILCTVGPLLSGTDLVIARSNIAAAVMARAAAGDDRVHSVEMNTQNDSPGCDWHPSIATHTAMADELSPVVQQLLGW